MMEKRAVIDENTPAEVDRAARPAPMPQTKEAADARQDDPTSRLAEGVAAAARKPRP